MVHEENTPLAQLRAALAGRYEIVSELGRGGMATVYLAKDVKHDRQVAVKVLKPELSASVGADRFLREIHIAAQLQHPHILMLIDSGQSNGLLYFVMPFVEGESLRDRLDREGPLPIEECVRITSEVADGLAYAHARGVVHRDIKPENIMLSRGHALIADFGISRAFGEAGGLTLTDTGMAVGTPAYMSPEQWTTATRVDARTDVYSLGCVLYEMLVGEPPFSGPTVQALLARHSMEAVPSIRVVRATVPAHIEAAVMRALAKVAADRFSTADEFAQALSAPGQEPRRRRQRTQQQAVPPGPRRRRALWLGAALMVAAAAAGVILVVPGLGETADNNRIVVAEFVNGTTDPALDDLGRIPVDLITITLQRANMPVISSPTAVQASQYLRARAVAEPEAEHNLALDLAGETGARYVVTGEFTRIADELNIQAHLTDVRSPGSLHSIDPVRTPAGDPSGGIERLRERVIGLIAARIDRRVSAEAHTMGQPPTFESYRKFNQGMEHYARNEFRRALEAFDQAFALDTTSVYALLYAALCHNNLNQWAQADSLSRIAERMRNELTDYHLAWLGYIRGQVSGQRQSSLESIRRAVELDPGSKAAYNLAYVALQANRPREAYDVLRTLNPDEGPMRGWFQYWSVLTDALHRLEDHSRELEAARRAKRAYPKELRSLRLEAEALAALGRSNELIPLLDSAQVLGGDSVTVVALLHSVGLELRAHGYAEQSRQVFDKAIAWFDARPQTLLLTEPYRRWKAAVLSDTYRWPEAEQHIASLVQDYPESAFYRGWLGQLLAQRRQRAEAQAIADWLAGLDQTYAFGAFSYQRARIAAVLGDTNVAVTLLQEAFNQGQPFRRHLDWNFETLRDHPDIARLIAPQN